MSSGFIFLFLLAVRRGTNVAFQHPSKGWTRQEGQCLYPEVRHKWTHHLFACHGFTSLQSFCLSFSISLDPLCLLVIILHFSEVILHPCIFSSCLLVVCLHHFVVALSLYLFLPICMFCYVAMCFFCPSVAFLSLCLYMLSFCISSWSVCIYLCPSLVCLPALMQDIFLCLKENVVV